MNPLPNPTISGPSPVCVGSTGNIYSTQAGMSGYIWAISSGGIITSGGGTNIITVTWNQVGSQTVSVNYNNIYGCSAQTLTVYNITVNPLPVPTINGLANVCVGSIGNVYITQTGMTNYIWTISSGGMITSGGGTGNNSVIVTWNTTGSQSVSVNYTNSFGCTAFSPTVYNITVNPLPVPTITGNTNLWSIQEITHTPLKRGCKIINGLFPRVELSIMAQVQISSPSHGSFRVINRLVSHTPVLLAAIQHHLPF